MSAQDTTTTQDQIALEMYLENQAEWDAEQAQLDWENSEAFEADNR
jgi:hypothetical protein